MHTRFVGATVVALSLCGSGCTYMSTYKSGMNLEKRSYSMDVKQRIVLSIPKKEKDKEGKVVDIRRVVCAEPSPEALTTISASLGADFAQGMAAAANRSASRNAPNGGSQSSSGGTNASNTVGAQLAAAFAEQGAFVGIRTAAIQTMRDILYAECQAYANGGVEDAEYSAFHRRHQSTMLGLIAIEQLTRPVVAQQVVLSSYAGAHAGTPPGDTALQQQQTRLDQKRKDNTEAQVELEKANADVAAVQKRISDNFDEEKKARAEAIAKTEGDAAKKQEEANKAAAPIIERRNALRQEERNLMTAQTAAQTRATAASQALQEALIDYKAAQGRAAASAGGSGQFGAARDSTALVTTDLIKGVKEIVVEINQSYLRDGCFALMSNFVNNRDLRGLEAPTNKDNFNPVAVIRTALRRCGEVLESEADRVLLRSASSTEERSAVQKTLQMRETDREKDRAAQRPQQTP